MARKADKDGKAARENTRSRALSRGFALFIGIFSLANFAATALGHGSNQNLWWIDSSTLSSWLGRHGAQAGLLVQVVAGILLTLWAIAPRCRGPRRWLTVVFTAALGLIALQNAIVYWSTLASGELYAALPLPLSLFVALCLAFICMSAARSGSPGSGGHGARGLVATVVVSMAVALVFPLLQICFFGTTDYRRSADAAVVFGAQVYDDGTLSTALSERMDTAIQLYSQGYVDAILVSGGTAGAGTANVGKNEAEAMSAYAQRHGVPASALVEDTAGDSTEQTVENSLSLAEERGFKTLIATSSFYHLPRIKLLYMANGTDVLTVPTIGDVAHDGTAQALWREIPGWWYYWAKTSLGS